MPLDLRKYLVMADTVDADVAIAEADVDAALAAYNTASVTYDAAVTHLNNLRDVQKMMRAVKASAGMVATEPVSGQIGGLSIDGIKTL